MALIHEEIRHAQIDAELMTSERQKGETREAWRFVNLSIGSMHALTPKELRELGRWLTREGKRIGREYTSKGAPKTALATKGQRNG